jgi:hypothetical protein
VFDERIEIPIVMEQIRAASGWGVCSHRHQNGLKALLGYRQTVSLLDSHVSPKRFPDVFKSLLFRLALANTSREARTFGNPVSRLRLGKDPSRALHEGN